MISGSERPTEKSLGHIMRGVGPAGLAVQLFSFISSVALAHIFGASVSTDAYYLGLSIPVLAYGLFIGALRQGAIPALTDVSTSSERTRFSESASELLRGVTAAAAIMTVIVVTAAWLLMPLIAHGYLLRETRIILLELTPYGVLGATAGVLGAILAVRGVFVLPVIVAGVESVLKIGLMLAFGDTLGVQSLVLGNLIGSALAVAALMISLKRRGVVLRLRGRIYSPFVRSTLALSVPLLVSMSVLQINPIVDRTMTAGLGGGKVTALELGLRLFLVPAGLITGLMIAPITATWAARFASDGWQAVQSSAAVAIRTVVVVVPPIVVLGFLLRRQLVYTLFAGGAYSASALRETASVLGMIVLSLPAQALIVVLATLFVVRKDTIFPMKVAFANVVLNVGLNFALRPLLGVGGIALSTSVTLTLLAVVYIVEARRRWGPLIGSGVEQLCLRTAGSIAVTAAFATAALSAIPVSRSHLENFAVVVAVGLGGLVVYGTVLAMSGDSTAREAVAWLRRRNLAEAA